MSKVDEFRQYADEAIRWAFQSKTEKERQACIELARTWTQAALHSEYIFGGNDNPPEALSGPRQLAVSQASSTLSFPKIISAHSDGAVRKELTW
jgi:hypothetical protein